MIPIGTRDIVKTLRHGHVCCGGGFGAKGFNRANVRTASARIGHLVGRFEWELYT